MNQMGNNEHGGDYLWGGEGQLGAQWGGDQWGGQGDHELALRSVEARYGRALASLGPAAVETSNTFTPIAETSIEIPMADLVAGARIMRKKKTNKGKNMLLGGSDCSGCTYGTHQTSPSSTTWPTPAPDVPVIVLGGFPSAEPELSSAWTRHRAIRNFERYHNDNFGKNLDNVTTIDEISMKPLGVSTWVRRWRICRRLPH